MPAKRIAVAVIVSAGSVVVGVRPPGVPLAGYAEFPGGKVEPGESPEDAAVRESLEETGLAVSVDDVWCITTHDYPHGVVEITFFRCRPLDASVIDAGAQLSPLRSPFVWTPIGQLAAKNFPPANAEILGILAQFAG